MNIFDNESMPEWAALGSELLEGSRMDSSYEESIRLLNTTGVDPALCMLFCSLPQGYMCIANKYPSGVWSVEEIRNLMRSAFMLGTYVKKSIDKVEKLW